jgi:hypothetical protein
VVGELRFVVPPGVDKRLQIVYRSGLDRKVVELMLDTGWREKRFTVVLTITDIASSPIKVMWKLLRG